MRSRLAACTVAVAVAAAANGCTDLELGTPSNAGSVSGAGGAGSGPGGSGGATSGSTGGAGSGAASSGGAGAGGGATCTLGDTRCGGTHGNEQMECDGDGNWVTAQLCTSVCNEGACVIPPSCSQSPKCGANESCCASYLVPGGEFFRSYDGVTPEGGDKSYPATISTFLFDRYEVTVARFRRWVEVYDQPGARPTVGSGNNPNNPEDPGWYSTWDGLLPADAEALRASLKSCSAEHTWTDVPGNGENEKKPINCVAWHTALAFCIWDQGRLPTAAERNFAAAGGDEQRVYPWSAPADSQMISPAFAVYYPDTPLSEVGTSDGDGDGRWGHADLGGNVWEWVQDVQVWPPPSTACNDCASLDNAFDRAYRGGGYLSSADDLHVALHDQGAEPEERLPSLGFRCARPWAPTQP